MNVISLGDGQIIISSNPVDFISEKGINNAYILNQSWRNVWGELLENLEKDSFRTVIIQGESMQRLNEIKQSIRCIRAGGGLVLNDNGDLLMIFRNGVWDLPKGKWETNETMAECALREVKEETGLQQIQLGELVETTHHFYRDDNGWVLKETEWYMMHAAVQKLVPQTEEGISLACWVSHNDLSKHLLNTYYSIKLVIQHTGLV